jgi:hypothetical protein
VIYFLTFYLIGCIYDQFITTYSSFNSKGQLLINRRWVDVQNGGTMATFDPTIEAEITQVAKASLGDADNVVKAIT